MSAFYAHFQNVSGYGFGLSLGAAISKENALLGQTLSN